MTLRLLISNKEVFIGLLIKAMNEKVSMRSIIFLVRHSYMLPKDCCVKLVSSMESYPFSPAFSLIYLFWLFPFKVKYYSSVEDEVNIIRIVAPLDSGCGTWTLYSYTD